MRATVLNALIRSCIIVLLLGFGGLFSCASAQSVVGVSEVLSSTNASEIDTYSATELSYDVSLYYGAAVEGFLYDGATQIRAGYAQDQQLAYGYLTAPVNVGDSYTVQSAHYLILSVAYSDGSGGYYYNNPDGFLGGDGEYPSGSSFEPGGGPAYVSTSYIYLGTTTVSISTAAPSITSISPSSVTIGTPGTITVNGSNLIDLFTQQSIPSLSGYGVNLTTGSSPTSDRVSLNYSFDSNASTGTQSLTLTTPFGTSNGANLTIGYPPATVTGLSPSTWTAGQSYEVQITGTNFGSTPTVSLSDPSINVGTPHNTASAGGNSTTVVNVSVQLATPSELVVVTVTPGSGGASFIQAPGGPSLTGSNTATVVGVQGGQNSCPQELDESSGFSKLTYTGLAVGGNGAMAISFSGGSFNGYGVTVPYGKFSTPESIASHLAALITQRYYRSGLSAEAYGAYILYKGRATLGTPNFTSSGTPLTADPSPSGCPPVSLNLRLVPVVSADEPISGGLTILHNVWRLVTLVGGTATLDYGVVEHIPVPRHGTVADGQGGYQSPANSAIANSPVNIFNDGIGCLSQANCPPPIPPYSQKFTITQLNGNNPGGTVQVWTRINGQDHLINTIYEHGPNAPTMNDPNKGPLPTSPDPYPQHGNYSCYTCSQ